MLDFTGERYMPTERIGADGRAQHPAYARARVAEFNPTDLWQPDAGPFAVKPLDLDFASLKTESFVDVFPPRRRKSGTAREELGKSFVQIAKRLLLAGLRNSGHKFKLRTKRGQLAGLCDVIELLPSLTLETPPMVAALFQGEIVNEAADASERLANLRLFRRWVELVSKASHLHLA